IFVILRRFVDATGGPSGTGGDLYDTRNARLFRAIARRWVPRSAPLCGLSEDDGSFRKFEP
ncbi:hypothetical protein, partial [Brevundimonas sp.]|uniref:hypothetical protein n=1 Tax=Brevundimonas sp. TaxID=1871086 RepID=UPI002FC8348B